MEHKSSYQPSYGVGGRGDMEGFHLQVEYQTEHMSVRAQCAFKRTVDAPHPRPMLKSIR